MIAIVNKIYRLNAMHMTHTIHDRTGCLSIEPHTGPLAGEPVLSCYRDRRRFDGMMSVLHT